MWTSSVEYRLYIIYIMDWKHNKKGKQQWTVKKDIKQKKEKKRKNSKEGQTNRKGRNKKRNTKEEETTTFHNITWLQDATGFSWLSLVSWLSGFPMRPRDHHMGIFQDVAGPKDLVHGLLWAALAAFVPWMVNLGIFRDFYWKIGKKTWANGLTKKKHWPFCEAIMVISWGYTGWTRFWRSLCGI